MSAPGSLEALEGAIRDARMVQYGPAGCVYAEFLHGGLLRRLIGSNGARLWAREEEGRVRVVIAHTGAERVIGGGDGFVRSEIDVEGTYSEALRIWSVVADALGVQHQIPPSSETTANIRFGRAERASSGSAQDVSRI